jgi:hypothetical protein
MLFKSGNSLIFEQNQERLGFQRLIRAEHCSLNVGTTGAPGDTGRSNCGEGVPRFRSRAVASRGQKGRWMSEDSEYLHIILTVHGIRTYGRWQERLQKLLANDRRWQNDQEKKEVLNYRYGRA